MEMERKCLRMGIWMIFLAVMLRLVDGGLGQSVSAFFAKPETAAFVLYLHTGRVLRPVRPQTEETVFEQTQTEETTLPETVPVQPQPQRPVFQLGDAELVDISRHCDYDVDLGSLLQMPLVWELAGEAPTVLIYHTHATESYTSSPGENYTESSAYRTLDTDYNMVSVGDYLARLLEAEGIRVIHDRSLHDEPSYSGAYTSSRKSVQRYLQEYPSIRLVLDLHRDALSLDSKKQLDTHATANGKPCAQLMMVVGTNAAGLVHPAWKENMALALKLHVLLEKAHPGICRPISFRTQRFNQDLSPGAMLIEVGAAGDSHAEALAAAEALARVIRALSHGTG